MSRIILPLCIILPPYHFTPIILPRPPPLKSFNDLRYLPMSRIILPPGFILPHIILPPIILPPPWKSLNVHYFFMSRIIPPIILPPIIPPLEIVSWFTLFTHVLYNFAPWIYFATWIHFAPYYFSPGKWFNDLNYLPMSRIILPLN